MRCLKQRSFLHYNESAKEEFTMLQDNLKALRKRKGITQEELATRLNVVRQTVSKWEKGLSVPDSELLIKLSGDFRSTGKPASRLQNRNGRTAGCFSGTAFQNQRTACNQKQACEKSLESNSLHRQRYYRRIYTDFNSRNRLYLFSRLIRHNNRQLAVY